MRHGTWVGIENSRAVPLCAYPRRWLRPWIACWLEEEHNSLGKEAAVFIRLLIVTYRGEDLGSPLSKLAGKEVSHLNQLCA